MEPIASNSYSEVSEKEDACSPHIVPDVNLAPVRFILIPISFETMNYTVNLQGLIVVDEPGDLREEVDSSYTSSMVQVY
jgi:hypothetical protein